MDVFPASLFNLHLMKELTLQLYTTPKGEQLLYAGAPDFAMLENLAAGPGDIWHSSFEQGYKNAFPELVYQTAVFFWYLNDFDTDQGVSWRVNPYQFAVRKHVWEQLGGFDKDFEDLNAAAFDFGFSALRYAGAVPLYVKGLFRATGSLHPKISVKDRYLFFRKNFKSIHSLYMLIRKGFWKPGEVNGYLRAHSSFTQRRALSVIQARTLQPVISESSVSYIIPTMFRQDFTRQLLDDLANQTYLPAQVVVVDATPESARTWFGEDIAKFPFEVVLIWQSSKGSCRARNEAIERCTGDYIIFGDDDIRIPPDFIYNHISFLQTYQAGACNGLDIRANRQTDGLSVLYDKLESMGDSRWQTGATGCFSNANSCVKADLVRALGGNDVNFDGGYGEDSDFGLSLSKRGEVVLFNPFSTNLHLKPEAGGYRWWGSQNRLKGKKRKVQPWEFVPVGMIRPVPSPTIMYGVMKHFTRTQQTEYKIKNLLLFLQSGSRWGLPLRLIKLPYRIMQFERSRFYARNLLLRRPN